MLTLQTFLYVFISWKSVWNVQKLLFG